MFRALFALLLLLLPAQAFALTGNWSGDDAVKMRLVSGFDGVGNETVLPMGLEIRLADNWHTYWRSPGQAGLPPQLDWSRSQTDAANVQSATLLYPAPHRYTAYGLETIGYRESVIFPIDLLLRTPGKAVRADLSLDILVCSSMCVPKHADLTLDVPAGAAVEGAEADLLHQARATLPSDSEESGLLLKGIASDGQSLSFTLTSRLPLTTPDIFVESERDINFSAPEVTLGAAGHEATLKVKLLDNLPPDALRNIPLTLTVVNGDRAAEMKATTPKVVATPPEMSPQKPSFALAFIFALIGGFILNLMPCVLPVLSLKVLSVVSHGGGETRKVRQSFLMTAAGILFSFLLLAIVMIALKDLGLALGWGVQFQQPAFLMFLVLLLTFFAANLWGLFEIPLPRFLADKVGQPKLAGDFATGAFATLLATPCSAPFLGTAVGFALASGAEEILAIFAALGFGMALPYILIVIFPRCATLLPKPGAWMLRLRQFLGGALALTALWLIWVMAAQITVKYAVAFGLLMVSVALMLALSKRGLAHRLFSAGIALACLAALFLGVSGSLKPRAAPTTDKQWIPFNEIALKADIAEGKTVFVDVTADWCLTCKANMKFTMSDDGVIQRLFHTDVIAMQADWTNPDPVVIDLLHRYGRYGIPFNIVFGPNAPQGIVLPELLTPELVLKAVEEAAGTTPKNQSSR